jgi:hypothetical protein
LINGGDVKPHREKSKEGEEGAEEEIIYHRETEHTEFRNKIGIKNQKARSDLILNFPHLFLSVASLSRW